jgi:hypothetical protein
MYVHMRFFRTTLHGLTFIATRLAACLTAQTTPG